MAHASTLVRQVVDSTANNRISFSERVQYLEAHTCKWTEKYCTPSKKGIDNRPHYFARRTLTAANKDNAAIEGANAPNPSHNDPTQLSAYSQYFTKSIKISTQAQNRGSYAVPEGEWKKQMMDKTKEIKRDMEAACFQQTGVLMAAGTAGKLNGMTELITTNTVNAGGAIALADISSLALQCWNSTGDAPDLLIANGAIRQDISGLFATRTVNDTIKIVSDGVVEHIITDFATIRLEADYFCTDDEAYMVNTDLWEIAPFKGMDWGYTELAKAGDFDHTLISGEYFQMCYNEAGNGKIYGITT